MTYRTIHLDIPIQIVPAPSSAAIDLGAPLVLLDTGSQVGTDGEQRHYYAAHPPLLMLVVARHGLDLSAIPTGAYVEALIGWDDGTSFYVLSAHAGRQHTKITITRLLPEGEPEATPLSAILARVPRLGQKGGLRPGAGRPLISDERMSSYDVTLPRRMASWLANLSGGNISAGVREAARRAGYEDPAP